MEDHCLEVIASVTFGKNDGGEPCEYYYDIPGETWAQIVKKISSSIRNNYDYDEEQFEEDFPGLISDIESEIDEQITEELNEADKDFGTTYMSYGEGNPDWSAGDTYGINSDVFEAIYGTIERMIESEK